AGLELVGNVGSAEEAGGEAHEGVEDDEDDVEVVDQEIAVGLGTADDEKRGGGDEGEQARHDIEPRGEPVAGQRREQRGGDRRDDENGLDGSERGHGRSPRLSSSSLTSTESKRSRMRKRKTPITISATSTEKATEI